MSVFTYNGITLPYAFHTQFRQEAVYDEQGQTDWTGTKFDIVVQAVINSNYLSQIAPEIAGRDTNAAEIMDYIRAKMMRPRRALSIKFNGVELIPRPANVPGTVDIDNGPKPQSCSVTMLATTTFLVTFHVIATYWESNPFNSFPAQNKPGSPVRFNRWSETLDVDNAGFQTRTRDGVYKIRTDMEEGLTAGELIPSMAAVGVPDGFVRESASYVVDPSGTAIRYRVTDREVFKYPPEPAMAARGVYTETCSRGGIIRHGAAHIQLKGKKTTPQQELVHRAVSVVSSKLFMRGAELRGPAPGPYITFIESAVLNVNMYENEVDYSCRVLFNTGDTPIQGVAAFVDTVERTGGSNPEKPPRQTVWTPRSDPPAPGPAPQPRFEVTGTGSVILQAAAYYDPSLKTIRLDPGQNQLVAKGKRLLWVGGAGKNKED